MSSIRCENCGASSFVVKNGYRTCTYCGAKHSIMSSDMSCDNVVSVENGIVLGSDVQRLLRMCEAFPEQAKKYANLILDIDPTNVEAKIILGRK